MAYFLDNYPVSEESSNLVLTEEQEKYCRVVYKLDEEGGAGFTGLWNPETEYSDEYVIVPLRSTGGKSVSIPANTCFANVIGSSSDYLVDGKKWLKLWVDVANNRKGTDSCSTDGKFYKSGLTGETYTSILYPVYDYAKSCWIDVNISAVCRDSLEGGHIILNATEAAYVPKNGNVYIVPICKMHNRSHISGKSWGVGFYMKMANNTNVVKLEGYLCGIKEYIAEFENEVRHE